MRRCYQAWPGIALARTPALLAVSGDAVQLAANASKKVASEQWQRNFFKRTKRVAHTNTHKRARVTCEARLSEAASHIVLT